MTANATSFKPGRSGNPGGRPKDKPLKDGKTLRDLAQERTVDALLTLEEVMKDEKAPAAARVSAASTILDRGWGRPVAPIEATVEYGDLAARILRARKRVDDLGAEGDEADATQAS